MSVARQPRLSFDDWLAIEQTVTDHRSEYVAGEVFAMAGGTEEHNPGRAVLDSVEPLAILGV